MTDNPVSLRLGTDISLHTSNKISSAVRQNKQYRLELTKMLLKKKRQKIQQLPHLSAFSLFAFLANLQVQE